MCSKNHHVVDHMSEPYASFVANRLVTECGVKPEEKSPFVVKIRHTEIRCDDATLTVEGVCSADVDWVSKEVKDKMCQETTRKIKIAMHAVEKKHSDAAMQWLGKLPERENFKHGDGDVVVEVNDADGFELLWTWTVFDEDGFKYRSRLHFLRNDETDYDVRMDLECEHSGFVLDYQ